MDAPRLVRTIDSHTEGEPTRVVLEGLGERTIDGHFAEWAQWAERRAAGEANAGGMPEVALGRRGRRGRPHP